MTLDIQRSGHVLGPFRVSLESEQRVAFFSSLNFLVRGAQLNRRNPNATKRAPIRAHSLRRTLL